MHVLWVWSIGFLIASPALYFLLMFFYFVFYASFVYHPRRPWWYNKWVWRELFELYDDERV